jgi:hypothetical protein
MKSNEVPVSVDEYGAVASSSVSFEMEQDGFVKSAILLASEDESEKL